MKKSIYLNAVCVLAILISSLTALAKAGSKPNIVYIICDDLGYGDVQCLAPETSKIPTPHTDKLAAEGMTFLDAHSGASVCTPTRYGLMTGRYSWRTPLQKGVVVGFDDCLIAEDRLTVAGFLKMQGYDTALLGKWHLNFRYTHPETGEDAYNHFKDDLNYKNQSEEYRKVISEILGAKIPDGPVSRGFDHFHGIHHARSMEVVIEDDEVVEIDPVINFLPRITKKSVEYIDSRAGNKKPFFLYLPLGSPHLPIVPTDEWKGKSGLGEYGDFVMQTDYVVGEVTKALKRNGMEDNTLIIFTSDNGCSNAAGIKDLDAQGHKVSAHYRGWKGKIYEGGHRIPFIVKWPGHVAPGTKNDQLICLTDFMATLADILDQKLPANVGEDSVSFLPALSGKEIKSSREGVIHHSGGGVFAYRMGKWKLILEEDREAKDGQKGQLYDMEADPSETKNLYATHGETVERLMAQFKKDVFSGRSTEGAKSPNDVEDSVIVLWKGETPKAKKNKK